jgi:hypothetical protein
VDALWPIPNAETNRIKQVMFDIQTRTFAPYVAAMYKVLFPVMDGTADLGRARK